MWVSTVKDTSGYRTFGNLGPVGDSHTIVHLSTTARTDTILIVVKNKNKFQTLRLVSHSEDMYTLSAATDKFSKLEDAMKPGKFADFFTLVSEERYVAAQRGKDVASISDEEIVAILTMLRADVANRKASHNFKKEMKQSMGLTLLNSLNLLVATELEMLGYNPFHWSMTPEEIIESRIANKQIAQLVEELRQMTKKL